MSHFKNKKTVYLSDLFHEISKTAKAAKKQRIEMLQEYANKDQNHQRALYGFIECMYHPAVVFDLPAGEPPYNKNTGYDANLAPESMFNFFHKRRVNYFAGPQKIANPVKREMMFVRFLENMYDRESKLLLAMKDKDDSKLTYIKEDLFREAFPTLLPEKESVGK